MARNFGQFKDIGIPPESTGPRIHNILFQSLELTGVAGGTIARSLAITGDTSLATGVIEQVITQAGTVNITVLIDRESPVQSFDQSENITIEGGITATVTSVTDVYVNASTIVGIENPYEGLRVDRAGSAHVRFEDGPQQLDALGVTRVTQSTLIDAFKFQYSELDDELSDTTAGAATLTHLPDESSCLLTCTTGATDSVIRAGDHYNAYRPGVGRTFTASITLGDTGKANNVRRWGMFDENDGLFFELDDTTLYFVVRSSTSGSPVDTRVAQADWNGDILDGSATVFNRSEVNLDITTNNMWWIDYAWYGAGRVRAGIYGPDGVRIIAHTVRNSNNNSTVYMKTGSLPVRLENVNSGVTSGASTLKCAAMAIKDDGQQEVLLTPETHSYVRTNVSANAETLIANFRQPATFNGIDNRITSTGTTATFATETSPVVIRIYKDATIGTPTWNAAAGASTPLEVDVAGTFAAGTLVASAVVSVNSTEEFDATLLDLHTKADTNESKTFTITAESLGAGASEVSMAVNWYDAG